MAQSNIVNRLWEEIEDEDDNMLVRLEEPRLKEVFLNDIASSIPQIEEIVSYHLHLNPTQKCTVADRSQWLSGSFNVCIPVTVSSMKQRFIFRCPLPFMLGSAKHSGELCDDDPVTEKIRCEAATFAWISLNCRNIPIPKLRGFGLPNGLRFVPIAEAPWYIRYVEYCKDIWAFVRFQPRCVPFTSQSLLPAFKPGYLLMDCIEAKQGRMLSIVGLPQTPLQKQNLYTSLAKIMLDMARHPLEKIASFAISDTGALRLNNRPLTKHLPLLEREGISSGISRNACYVSVNDYVNDLLECLDSKLAGRPNAIRDEDDADAQLSAHTMLRAVRGHCMQREHWNGPFVMRLTDLHDSNIFVDTDYNVAALVDLEFTCSLPIETYHPPFWLTGRMVDQLGEAEYYEPLYEEWDKFIEIIAQEEGYRSHANGSSLSDIMKMSRSRNMHWYWACLVTPRATFNLFIEHIQPIFAPDHWHDDELAINFQNIVARYWRPQTKDFVSKKLKERESYLGELRKKYKPSTERAGCT